MDKKFNKKKRYEISIVVTTKKGELELKFDSKDFTEDDKYELMRFLFGQSAQLKEEK